MTLPPPVETQEEIDLEAMWNEGLRCESAHNPGPHGTPPPPECAIVASARCTSCRGMKLWCQPMVAYFLDNATRAAPCYGCKRPVLECWQITPL